MKIGYKNQTLENVIVSATAIAAITTVFTFVALFGFKKPLLEAEILFATQIILFCFFLFEKTYSLFQC